MRYTQYYLWSPGLTGGCTSDPSRPSSPHPLWFSEPRTRVLVFQAPFRLLRLEELQTFLLYKNKLTYLPYELLNLKKLSLLVVSGDRLVELPTALCDSSTPLK